jgi:hypothetical protein
MAKARSRSPKVSAPRWPAAQVESWPIARLIPYARNARTHSDAQIAQIAGSMREFGWTVPVLCDEAGTIIAGHGRVLAGRLLNYDMVPVMVARGWSEAQKRAYRLADNKLALLSGWDHELLPLELADLRELFDVSLTGFSVDEIDGLFAPENDPTAEWQGMPEFEQNSRMAFKTIALHFPDAEAIEKFAKLIDQPMTAKTRFIWFPQQPIANVTDKRYASEQQETAAE